MTTAQQRRDQRLSDVAGASGQGTSIARCLAECQRDSIRERDTPDASFLHSTFRLSMPSFDVAPAFPASPGSRSPMSSREYPNKPDHVLTGDGDVRRPRALHPAFDGSFDWHSCVHMHWLLARVRRAASGAAQRAAIDASSTRTSRSAMHRRRSECTCSGRRPQRSSARTAGRGCSSLRASSSRGSAASTLAVLAPLARRLRRALPRLSSSRSDTRCATACTRTARSASRSRSTLRARRARRRERRASEAARAGSSTTAMRRRGLEPSGADFLSPALMEADLDAPRARRSDFTSMARRLSCRARAAQRPRSAGPRATAATRRSCISTASTCRVRGASRALRGASGARCACCDRAACVGAHLDAGMLGVESGEYVGALARDLRDSCARRGVTLKEKPGAGPGCSFERRGVRKATPRRYGFRCGR